MSGTSSSRRRRDAADTRTKPRPVAASTSRSSTAGIAPNLGVRSLLLALLALGCAGDGPPSATGPSPEETTPRPLVVVGVDGATWDLIDPMMERGELPNLQRLVRRGMRADLISIPPLSSPVVWTTFGTGRFARHHNILDHTYPYAPGPKRRVDSTLRRVPALWNIATHYARSVGVIGYYGSHPPEIINGAMISDRAAEGVPGAIYPNELSSALQGEIARLRDDDEKQKIYQKYLPWHFDLMAIHRPEDPYHRVTKIVRGRIHRHSLLEELVQRAALFLAPREFDLFMVYLRMPDHASHATWLYFDDSHFAEKPDPFDKSLLEKIIPAAYRDTDGFLGKLLEAVGESVNIVILSDHGFGPAAGNWRKKIKPEELYYLSGSHRPAGIFLAAGPDIRQGELEGLTSLDIAPTLLALLGLPVSGEFAGRAEVDIFRPDFLVRFPLREVPGFRMRWQAWAEAEAPSGELEAEGLETLAALGYLDQGAPVAGEPANRDIDFWATDESHRHNVIVGEMVFYMLRSDLESVARLMSLVEEKDPLFLRHLPRLVRQHLDLWQEGFDFPLVPESTRETFDSTYPGFYYFPATDAG